MEFSRGALEFGTTPHTYFCQVQSHKITVLGYSFLCNVIKNLSNRDIKCKRNYQY